MALILFSSASPGKIIKNFLDVSERVESILKNGIYIKFCDRQESRLERKYRK
jgi:hypothetical protein